MDRLIALAILLAIPAACAIAQDATKDGEFARHAQPGHRYGIYYLTNDGMMPTIHAHSDQMLVDESAYESTEPLRGDIILFLAPLSTRDMLVARIVALPGDKLAINNNLIRVNGIPLREPLMRPDYTFSINSFRLVATGVPLDTTNADVPPRSRWTSPNTLPQGCYFVLGDNVKSSMDSHVWGCAELRGKFSSGPLRGKPTKLIGKIVTVVAAVPHR